MDPRDWRYTGRRPTDMDRYTPYNTSRRPAYNAMSYNTDNSRLDPPPSHHFGRANPNRFLDPPPPHHFGGDNPNRLFDLPPPHNFGGANTNNSIQGPPPAYHFEDCIVVPGFQESRNQFTLKNAPNHRQGPPNHLSRQDEHRYQGRQGPPDYGKPPRQNLDPWRESRNASSSHGTAIDGVKCEVKVKQELDDDEEWLNDDSHGGVTCGVDIKQELDGDDVWFNGETNDADDVPGKKLNTSWNTPVNFTAQGMTYLHNKQNTCRDMPIPLQGTISAHNKQQNTCGKKPDEPLRRPWEYSKVEFALMNTPESHLQRFASTYGYPHLDNFVVCKLLLRDHTHFTKSDSIVISSFKNCGYGEIVFEATSDYKPVYRARWRDMTLVEVPVSKRGLEFALKKVATDLLVRLEYTFYTLKYNPDYYSQEAYQKRLQEKVFPGVYRLVTKKEAPNVEAAWRLVTDLVATDSDEDLIFTLFSGFSPIMIKQIKEMVLKRMDVDCISKKTHMYVFVRRTPQYWRDRFLSCGVLHNMKLILEPPIPQRSQQQEPKTTQQKQGQTKKQQKGKGNKPKKKSKMLKMTKKAVKEKKAHVLEKLTQGVSLNKIQHYHFLPQKMQRKCEKFASVIESINCQTKKKNKNKN